MFPPGHVPDHQANFQSKDKQKAQKVEGEQKKKKSASFGPSPYPLFSQSFRKIAKSEM